MATKPKKPLKPRAVKEKLMILHPEIREGLKSGGVLDYFEALAYSHQKEYLSWIEEAKKEETKAKRLMKTIEMLKEKRS